MDGVTRVLARIAEIESRISGLGGLQLYGAGLSGPQAVAPTGTRYGSFQNYLGADRGQQVVNSAMRFLGVPYVWAGEGPKGFDCSGLVKYVFKEMGVDLPHYTVTQAQQGTPVDRASLRPGDVIFFGRDGGKGFLYHVGIYVGNNSFIQAPHTGDVVKVSKLEGNYDTNYACARRYL